MEEDQKEHESSGREYFQAELWPEGVKGVPKPAEDVASYNGATEAPEGGRGVLRGRFELSGGPNAGWVELDLRVESGEWVLFQYHKGFYGSMEHRSSNLCLACQLDEMLDWHMVLRDLRGPGMADSDRS